MVFPPAVPELEEPVVAVGAGRVAEGAVVLVAAGAGLEVAVMTGGRVDVAVAAPKGFGVGLTVSSGLTFSAGDRVVGKLQANWIRTMTITSPISIE